MQRIRLQGMTGLGDSIHQISIVKMLLLLGNEVQLETPWPQIYRDIGSDKLKLLPLEPKDFKIFHHASKNQSSIGSSAYTENCQYDKKFNVHYHLPGQIQKFGFVGAMMENCGLQNMPLMNFNFSPKIESIYSVLEKIDNFGKPILLTKPITIRDEWRHSNQRAPEIYAYDELLRFTIKSIPNCHVVSICDRANGVEKIISSPIGHQIFHDGELSIEEVFALTYISKLTFCPPGFMIPVSQGLGTPCISVFGGRETSSFYKAGVNDYYFCGIDPITPCGCFEEGHDCNKKIDIDAAKKEIRKFIFGKMTTSTPWQLRRI